MSIEFSNRPIIITDFETTGLYSRNHEVIEIGAIKVDQTNLEEKDRLDIKVQMVWPQVATPEALAVNGYRDEDWAGARSKRDAFQQYMDFADGGVLCAWNITFEHEFLETELERLYMTNRMDYHRIDLPSIVWALSHGRKSMSMDAVATESDLPPEQKPHRAIRGAEQELAILRILHQNAVAGRTEY